MPPKSAQKLKAEAKIPATSEKSKSKPKAETPTKTPTKIPTKKAGSKEVEWANLEEDNSGAVVPIDVSFEGSAQSSHRVKGVPYGKLLRLQADNAFTVTKTLMLTEGEYAGHQAIIVRPAKPFDFAKIPDVARVLVYRYYFAYNDVANNAIPIDGKRTSNKEPFAKTFAKGSKNRVALLTAGKEIHSEAVQIFNALPLKFENTTAIMDFFTANSSLRERVTNIEIRTYQKTSARNALHLLSEAKKLIRLHFSSGVFNEGDPIKAAKAFWNDGYKFLQAVGDRREDKDKSKAVEVLSFSKNAFSQKDSSKKDASATTQWSNSMVEEFKQALIGKLTSGK